MIGASDLNRLPRWMPERQPGELRRYARSELGGEAFALRVASKPSTSFRGFRAWLAARFRPAVAEPDARQPLGAGIAAVRFSGETVRPTRQTPASAQVLPVSSLVFATPTKASEPDELCDCDL